MFESAWLQRLDAMALRRFADSVLAEEASTYVIEHLSEDDWARCRGFSGQSRPTTYLFSVSSNLIEEFARKRFGRLRPPRWLQRQGEPWLTLWRQLCLDRQPIEAVVDQLRAARGCMEEFLRNTIRVIKARIPDCGQAAPRSAELPEDSLSDDPPEMYHDRQHFEETALLISWVLNGEDDHLTSMMNNETETLPTCLETFTERLQLKPEQLLVLQLVYRDGMNPTSVARLLDMPAHRPGRILKRTLAQLAQTLRESGIDADSLQDQFRLQPARST